MPSFTLERRLKGHTQVVTSVRFNHNGRYCMSTSQDRSIRLWNPSSAACEPIKTYTGPHNRDVNDCCMTDDNAKFVSAGADKYVFLWDVATAKIIRRFARHRGPVNCCDFAGQEQSVLLTGSNDKTVMLWDWRAFTNNKPLQTLTEAYDSVQAIKVINEYEILTGSVDGCLRRYDIRYGRLTVDEFDGQSISCIASSSDSRYLLLGMLDSGIRLIETQTGRVVKNYKGKHVNRSYKVYCTFDGCENLVLTGSEAGSMAWYDVADDDSTGFASAPANSGAVLCVRAYESQVLATTQSGEILVYRSDSQESGGPIMDANLADALKFEGTNFLLVMIGAVVRQVLDAILLALLPLGYIISRVWARMRQRTEPPGVVLVTGAGGEGLGAMLALQYAGPSTRKLILTDIHRASLEPVAEACRAKGTAEVVLVEADVCDEAAMAKIADDHPDVDLVIANAGVAAHTVSGATAAQPTPPVTESSAKLLSINVLGVMNTILPFVDPMRRRGSGHLVIMSSMGSYLPTAASPEYHASKACVRVYGESLRVLLRGTGVNVTVICPGFVKTPMTDLAASRHVHPLPLMVSGEDAARKCKRGIDANMAVVSFPSPLLWITETVMSWPSPVRELIIPCPPGAQASRLARIVP